MLSYALGRGAEASDQPYIRAIMRDAAPGSYAFESLIAGIVNSVPFQQTAVACVDDGESCGGAAVDIARRRESVW